MTRCKKYKILIPLSFYGDISSKEAAKLQKHIETCEICRGEYKNTALSLKMLSKTQKLKPDKKQFDRIEKLIDDKITRSRIVYHSQKKPAVSLSYAALMMILLVSALLALKNPASYPKVNSSRHSPSNNLFYPNINGDIKNRFLPAEDQAGFGRSAEVNPDSEMTAIISNFVNIIYTDNDFEVRKYAIIAIAQIGTPLAVNSLMEVSRSHPDPATRIEAIRCLAQLSKESYERRHLIEI